MNSNFRALRVMAITGFEKRVKGTTGEHKGSTAQVAGDLSHGMKLTANMSPTTQLFQVLRVVVGFCGRSAACGSDECLPPLN